MHSVLKFNPYQKQVINNNNIITNMEGVILISRGGDKPVTMQ